MSEKRLLFQYGLKLNELKIKKIIISSISLFITLFMFYTSFDFLFFMNANADLSINKDVSNRTISIDLSKQQIYEPLLDFQMVESFEIIEWDTEETFLLIRLNSYRDVKSFTEAVNEQSLLTTYNHSLSSQAKSLIHVKNLMGVFVKLVLITSVLMLIYILNKEHILYYDTLRIMYILGIKRHILLKNYLLKHVSFFSTSYLFSLILERLLIRKIIFKIVFPNLEGASYMIPNHLAHLFIIILSLTILGTCFLIGVNRDFKSIKN